MDIEFTAEPCGHIVAWERQFGTREGRFIVDTDGSVSYWHHWDRKFWHAGATIDQFRACAAAWNRRVADGQGMPEDAQLAAVARLRAFLEDAGVLQVDNSVWSVFLEQAEQGML